LIDVRHIGRQDAEEGCLHIHGLIEGQIVAVHQDGRAGILVELAQAADVVNVRMRANDGFDGEAAPSEKVENALDLIARVYHESFARERVANDRTIALKYADGNGDVNQTLLGGIERGQTSQGISHSAIIALDSEVLWRHCEAAIGL